ncbi:hypothetical protein [Paucilactobacillus nenjiangensis]|uniref:hypothetical protein n=1 Tax=Paucilactobacillus nenjiangensis TaxID=1296540 RepID=UPI003BB4D08F
MNNKSFHIIRILSDTELIIDGGENDSLYLDQHFIIKDTDGEEIVDLNNKVIGFLGAEKAEMSLSQLYDKFSVLKSEFVESRQVTVYKNGFAAKSLTQMAGSDKYVPSHYEKLKIDTRDLEPLKNTSAIKKGDIAITVSENPNEEE